MKIAVVVSTFPPYPGGMGNAALQHAEMLRKAGHQVTVLAPGHGLDPVVRVGNAAWIPQLAWRLKQFDAVELHYPFFGGAEFVWLWKILFGKKKRLVAVYHMDTVGRGLLGLIFRLYRAVFMHPILDAADRIVTASLDYLSTSQAKDFAKYPHVYEAPFPVDVEMYRPGRMRSASDVVFVGGLDRAHYFKGINVLLEAMRRVAKNHPGATLTIVGDGDLRADYEAEAKRLGIDDRVRFLGRVSDSEKAQRLQRATIHVLPSVDRSEAFGIVTLEAAASGTPSIVSDLPGVRSVVKPGTTGLVVPPNDPAALATAIGELLDHPAKTTEMGRHARSRAEDTYAEGHVARRLVEAFAN